MEVQIGLKSLAEWKQWLASNPWAVDKKYIEDLVACTQFHGIISHFLGRLASTDIDVPDSNYRESLLACGLNPRARAVLDYIAQAPEASEALTTRIYAPEALTPFALALRGRYPRFLGSEYTEDGAGLFPIPNENIQGLSFPDASFDIVVCNEIFEHVPDLSRTAGEIARVLRPSGFLLATFPFGYDQEETVVKAFWEDGKLRIIGEPEYHRNPTDKTDRSLVFQIPGWDILPLFSKAGFAEVSMLFISSKNAGITGAEVAGIFLLKATR